MRNAALFVSLDYETYSDVDLWKRGSAAYAEHASTEVLIVAWSMNGGAVQSWHVGQPLGLLQSLKLAIASGYTVRAYNASFEQQITNGPAGRKLGMPPIQNAQLDDTMAMVAMVGLPLSLAKAGAALGLSSQFQKDADGTRLIRVFCIPRKPTKIDQRVRVKPSDAPGDFEKFVNYCRRDVTAEMAVRAALPITALPKFERRVWQLDRAINAKGFKIDRQFCVSALKIADAAQWLLKAKLKKITDGAVDSPTKVAALKAWLLSKGADVPSFDKRFIGDTLEKLKGDARIPDECYEAIDIRVESGASSANKYKSLLAYSSDDDRVRNVLLYHGAQQTGRWAGRGPQPHNFARPEGNDSCLVSMVRSGNVRALSLFNDNPLKILKNVVRHAIVAEKGKVLVVSDLASIEARVIGWLANDQTYLDVFRRGEDIYKFTAAIIFGVRYEDVTDDQRFVGKAAVLGLGYGMGWKKFQEMVRGWGVSLPEALCKKTVAAYRSKYHRIPLFWSAIEASAISAVRSCALVECGVLAFEMVDHWLTMILPSGRRLWYPHVEVVTVEKFGRFMPELRFQRDFVNGHKQSTWGGTLAENSDQAISRDLLAGAMLDMEMVYVPVLHVHDEVVLEVHEHEADEARKLLDAAMTTPPPLWGKGIPLDAKSFISSIYRKG